LTGAINLRPSTTTTEDGLKWRFQMSRIITTATAVALIIATTVAWSNFMVIKPEAQEGSLIVSSLDIIQKCGKILPVEA
jgi:hypothetical protein